MRFWGAFIVAASAACVAVTAWAQSAANAPVAIRNAPVEIVRNHVSYDVAADGTYTKKQEQVFRILTQQGLELLRQFSVTYSSSYEDSDLVEAYTLKKDGTRIDVPADKIFLSYGPVTAPGFNDFKIKSAVFQNVEVGDEVGVTTTFRQKTPWFAGQFYTSQVFGQLLPQHDVRIDVRASTRLPLHVDAAGLQGGQTQVEGDTQTWAWTFQNDTPVMPEPGTVAEAETGGDLIISSFPDYAAIAKAYEDGARGKATATPQVQALADQLTQGITDKRQQARVLYEWVSKNIKYLAIVLGNGGLVPHSANEVLANRYGDCKDHVVLLQALLAAEGIPSTTALINAGASFKISPVAAPDQFNHAITYVPQFDLYLDSTVHYAPFGILPEQDIDKTVLLTGTGALAHTPGPSAFASSINVVTAVRVHADGSADGDTRVSLSGPFAMAMRTVMDAMLPGSESQFIRGAVAGATDGTLDKGDPSNLSDPYTVSLHYNLGNAVNIPGPGAVSLWLGYHPFSMAAAAAPNLPARHSDFLCSSFVATDEETITLPEGHMLTNLPKAAEVDTQGLSLTATYERQGRDTIRIVRTMRAQRPHLVCSADDYNRIRPDLTKMIGVLSAQALYK
jgi:transglutaminase-like putative cysteine protease